MAVLIECRTCASLNGYNQKESSTYRQLTRGPVVPPKNMFTNCFPCLATRARYIVTTAYHITPHTNR